MRNRPMKNGPMKNGPMKNGRFRSFLTINVPQVAFFFRHLPYGPFLRKLPFLVNYL